MAHQTQIENEWAAAPAVPHPPLALVPTPPAATVTADLSGTVQDSMVAVGNGNTQISTGGGDCIINQSAHRPPQARETICVLPRTQGDLFGRDSEILLARDTIAGREPVQFHGRRGAGKTALLRHVAHASSSACPEGVVYFRASGTTLDDLLQALFDFLFESEIPTKRTPGQLACDLAGWEVLFVLDDVGLDEDDLETLLDTVPMSAFVLSSPDRTLWSAGEGAELRGLPQDAALALFEARLRRPLSGPERAGFTQRWLALDGLPQQLVKDAERLRAATRSNDPGSLAPPAPQDLSDLTPADRDLLKLTAALDGVPLGNAHLAELSGQPDAAARLARLEDRGLTQSHSPRYSATAPSSSLLGESEAVLVRHNLLAYFSDRAERGAVDPKRPRDDLDPIVALLRWGQTAAPHADVLRLARASDTIAARAGMWDAWRTILEIGLGSARAIGDRAGEAWALHQLGTRALCLEEGFAARGLLRDALSLRERLGDRLGAANTRHNMRFLPGGPGAPDGSNDLSPFGSGPAGGGGGGAAGWTGGLGGSLLAPASWPLLWALVPVLVLVGVIAATTPFMGGGASTRDVALDATSDLHQDRHVRSARCGARAGCATTATCSGTASCAGTQTPRQTSADRGADTSKSGGARAPAADPLAARTAAGRPGDEPSRGMPPGAAPGDDGSAVGKDGDVIDVDPSETGTPDHDPIDTTPVLDSLDDHSDAKPKLPASVAVAATYGASQVVTTSQPSPTCDHFAAIVTFVREELGLAPRVLALELAIVVSESLDHVTELLERLHCGSATSGILARLLAPLHP